MSKSSILTVLMFISVVIYGQDLTITFTATGAATQIDNVTATNLRTNQSVTMPGDDTLILAVNTGIPSFWDLNQKGIVFPNPFSGKTTLVTNIQKPQTVYIRVQNLTGQTIVQDQIDVQSGLQNFAFSVSRTGIYLVSLTTDQGTASYKVICTNATETGNGIQYAGIEQGTDQAPSTPQFKSYTTVYSLGYAIGDIIHYKCNSGIYTTIITDMPASSKNYEVEFVACADPDGKGYAIVKIGTQIWMAENLAYLPAVSPSNIGSDSAKYYYVYGYEGTSVDAAKDSANYATFGVLYNWPAAMDGEDGSNSVPSGIQGVCPTGWHMPSDGEWKILEKNLGMSQLDADSINWRNSGEVGNKLKSSTGWLDDDNGTNLSGFTALPGGYRNTHGVFRSIDNYALFWSASNTDTLSWYRNFAGIDDGVYRHTTFKSHGFSVRCVKDD
ncbi:MAG: T9SS type A sorting domain-containing protein [Bacteroidetes bacterium]|nr:T9SS type A sorting domain-containing protein [Bacteroidota bacterium]